MRASESQGSFVRRISIRRNQVASMEINHEHELEILDLFQNQVSTRFSNLLHPDPNDNNNNNLLSIAWLRKLLDAFLCCEAEFKAVLISHISNPPPLDRIVVLDLLDRTVKALDICNAVTHGVESVRNWQKSAEIVVCALEQRPIGKGQIRRAKKALLSSIAAAVSIHDKENNPARSTERTWSLGRRGGGGGGAGTSPKKGDGGNNLGSLSWSAAKQIQAMSANLAPPRSNGGGGEISALARSVYVMSTVLVFVMWALVVAIIPCQDRTGLPAHLPIPRNLGWAQSIIGLQERISEEWKKNEKKGSGGLMEEMQRVEKLCVSSMELADSSMFPVEDERVQEIAAQVGELAEICRKMEQGLVPLQQQIREVFHRIIRSRTEVLEELGPS